MKFGSSRILILTLAITFAGWSSASGRSETAGKHSQPAKTQSHAKSTKRRYQPRSSSKIKHAASKQTTHKSRHRLDRGRDRKVATRRPNAYTRLAHMQMAPSRVEDIQQALINAGDLHGTPSGHWDSDTRNAMARYQADNGFGVTGLPDAKSLMKLGLGPHPLPAQLDKTKASPLEAGAGTPAASPASTPSQGPGPTDPPAKQ